MPHRLTDAQLSTLQTLQAQGYGPGDVVQARDAFPSRNAEDNGHRRALEGLCRAGVLDNAAGQQGVPAWASGAYLVRHDTYQALERLRERDRDHGLEW